MAYSDFSSGPLQTRVAKLLDEGVTSTRKIAKELHADEGSVRRAKRKLFGVAGKKDRREHLDKTPDGFAIKKTSTYYQKTETEPAQWVIRNQDAEKQAEMLKEYIAGLCTDITPSEPQDLPTLQHDPNLMTGIFIGDAHIGLQAFASETRHSDFNVDIACEQLRNAVDYLVDRAEPSEIGLLCDVGDFMHANGKASTTFKGTPVDTSLTHYRVMHAAGSVMRYMIDKMLTKFRRVLVVVTPGNHDTDPAIGLQVAIEMVYSLEPRVQILKNDSFLNYIEYGKWLLGFCHGDKQKPEALVANMARDMASAWGRTTHRMWCTGHFHKESVKTFPGCKHKVFGALPPPDSWHAGQGYLGDGEMEMLTFRKEGGLYSSHVYNIPQPRQEPDVRI